MRYARGTDEDRKGGKRLISKVLMWVSILMAIALAVLNLTYQFGLEPDTVYPMTNQRITWNNEKK